MPSHSGLTFQYTHHSYNRECFANGACDCADWIGDILSRLQICCFFLRKTET
ncbi:hypothetical protein G4407_02100 [Coprococcus comes]|nr:hypothetical protein [Coprococcus comes]